MSEKEEITINNLDITRYAFGAYASYADKPARVEVWVYKDGSSVEEVYGQVNPCKFGDQCEGYACYCNNPRAYRKCHGSWFTGGETSDKECPYYEPNPYWQDGEGDFDEQRERTLLYLKEKGLLELTVEYGKSKAPEYYKGRHSKLI